MTGLVVETLYQQSTPLISKATYDSSVALIADGATSQEVASFIDGVITVASTGKHLQMAAQALEDVTQGCCFRKW